jgi:hypothetical protein
MRRRIGEWLLSAGAVALLLLALVVIYAPVREDARRVMSRPSAEVSSVVQRVRYHAGNGAAMAREQYRSKTELVLFGIAAVVLFGFMLRT